MDGIVATVEDVTQPKLVARITVGLYNRVADLLGFAERPVLFENEIN
jgi:hypothetical protein